MRSGRRHPGMHRTKTLDYAIVLSGEIYAVLDEEEVLLKAGDVLVQQGTNPRLEQPHRQASHDRLRAHRCENLI